jgi:hypothetical protein
MKRLTLHRIALSLLLSSFAYSYEGVGSRGKIEVEEWTLVEADEKLEIEWISVVVEGLEGLTSR